MILMLTACAVDLDWKQMVFHYNRTFGAEPSSDGSTEAAWDSIVPCKWNLACHGL